MNLFNGQLYFIGEDCYRAIRRLQYSYVIRKLLQAQDGICIKSREIFHWYELMKKS